MAVDGFWVATLVVAAIVVASGLLHELDERRWRRERDAEEAGKRAAE